MALTATALEGETVGEVCWRVLGTTRSVVEQVLEGNPGLADLGPRLPGERRSSCPPTPPPRARPPSKPSACGIESMRKIDSCVPP
jgi:phage tail protein X